MRLLGAFLVSGLAACEKQETPDTGSASTSTDLNPVDYQYQTFCWTRTVDGCKYDNGNDASDVRAECTGADYYDCATDRLDREGEHGWHLMSDESFPDWSVVYLMVRVAP